MPSFFAIHCTFAIYIMKIAPSHGKYWFFSLIIVQVQGREKSFCLVTLFMFRYVDGSWRYKSLDDIWYYGGQDEHQQEAIMAHNAKDREEIDLNVGDIIGVAGNHWNGYNKGRNHANNRIGLYPEYKTKEKLKIVSFPSYPHVHL